MGTLVEKIDIQAERAGILATATAGIGRLGDLTLAGLRWGFGGGAGVPGPLHRLWTLAARLQKIGKISRPLAGLAGMAILWQSGRALSRLVGATRDPSRDRFQDGMIVWGGGLTVFNLLAPILNLRAGVLRAAMMGSGAAALLSDAVGLIYSAATGASKGELLLQIGTLIVFNTDEMQLTLYRELYHASFGSRRLSVARPSESWEQLVIRRELIATAVWALRGYRPARRQLERIAKTDAPIGGAARAILGQWEELVGIATERELETLGRKGSTLYEKGFKRLAHALLGGGKEAVQREAELLSSGPSGVASRLYDESRTKSIDETLYGLVEHDIFNRSGEMLGFLADGLVGHPPIHRTAAYLDCQPDTRNLYVIILSTMIPRCLLKGHDKLQIRVEGLEELHLAEGTDRWRVAQILSELFVNATKYHDPKKPRHQIRIAWDEGKRELVVEDNGKGITDTAAVWEWGYRSPEAGRQAKGLGLGLWGVKKRIDELGWGIRLDSEPGKGTRFIVTPREGDIVRQPSPVQPVPPQLASRVPRQFTECGDPYTLAKLAEEFYEPHFRKIAQLISRGEEGVRAAQAHARNLQRHEGQALDELWVTLFGEAQHTFLRHYSVASPLHSLAQIGDPATFPLLSGRALKHLLRLEVPPVNSDHGILLAKTPPASSEEFYARGEALSRAVLREWEGEVGYQGILVEIAGSDSFLAPVAQLVREYEPRLKGLLRVTGPEEFGLKAQEIYRQAFGTYAHRYLSAGPEKARQFALEVRLGPGNLLAEIFHQKFGTRADELAVSIVAHDFISKPLSSFNLLRDPRTPHLLPPSRLAFYIHFDPSSRLFRERVTQAILAPSLAASSQGIRVEIDIPENLLISEELPFERVSRAVEELTQNAAKYHDPAKGERRISLRWDATEQCLVIEDNGLGIRDPERVWETGYREADRYSNVEGTGLGMGMVREQLESVGWSIRCDSHVGHGTRFTLKPAQGHIREPYRPAVRRVARPPRGMRRAERPFELPQALWTADLPSRLDRHWFGRADVLAKVASEALDDHEGALAALRALAASDASMAGAAKNILDNLEFLRRLREVHGPLGFAEEVDRFYSGQWGSFETLAAGGDIGRRRLTQQARDLSLGTSRVINELWKRPSGGREAYAWLDHYSIKDPITLLTQLTEGIEMDQIFRILNRPTRRRT